MTSNQKYVLIVLHNINKRNAFYICFFYVKLGGEPNFDDRNSFISAFTYYKSTGVLLQVLEVC